MSVVTSIGGHKRRRSQASAVTSVGGHKRRRSQASAVTSVGGHKRRWSQASAVTSVGGHKRRRSQASAVTSVGGHKRRRSQGSAVTNVSGHKCRATPWAAAITELGGLRYLLVENQVKKKRLIESMKGTAYLSNHLFPFRVCTRRFNPQLFHGVCVRVRVCTCISIS